VLLDDTSMTANHASANGGGIHASRATLTDAVAGTNVLADVPNDIVP
jgi:predicted outer membrane repeat protein